MMKDENFEKQDQSLKEAFRPFREKKVPQEILRNFTASVEEQILKRQAGKVPAQRASLWDGFRPWIPVLVPALGALAIFISVTLFKGPLPMAPKVAQIAMSVTELSIEIAALEELGLWTETDDAAIDSSLVGF